MERKMLHSGMNRSHDYDKILTRLTLILHRLYSGESLSVKELAEEFNVSAKTIQRDFNERLIRFPLEKSGRRWRMREGFRIEKVQESDNILALEILETIASGIGSEFAQRSNMLLSKLKNRTAAPISSYVNFEDISGFKELFREIEEAILSGRELLFVYHEKPRTVHPYRIVNFDGYWYLLAKEGEIVKKFYIPEIKNLSLSGETFTPEIELKERLEWALNAWFDPNAEPFTLHLLARGAIVKYLKRRALSPTQLFVAHHENSDAEITLKVSCTAEALMLLKPWIPDLAVISPADVKEAFEKMLKKGLDFQTGHDAF
ncbi:transcriptional regulator, putative [Hydrogenimonas sp.]|nr:transcriptional regulator, putative [Hydrogenimonas sp.]